MTPEQYEKAGEIYHAALELPPERRAEFVEQACAGDRELRGEVESLLAAHAAAGRFFEAAPDHLNSLLRAVLEAPPSDRALAPGQRLGRYEVVGFLGAGGMGTVYRALDPTLGRHVAIKSLAPTFRGDSASLRRFAREARVLATLSHPNIATIYGFEQLEGSPYLVLEQVEGETLANRLSRGAMSIEETLRVAEQIVAGLEEAHGKGVIHRDLKPSNVMLTPDGRVKLVDFGLAKTAGPEPRPDVSAEPITAAGVVIGTARYMSPEQVKGENVDMRTDVWAFGCVLYEMLTARPVFAGRSISEVVAAVLRDEPDWDALPPGTPRNVTRLLRRCLRRDPRLRLQHIGDARLELVDTMDESAAVLASAARSSTRSRAGWIVAALAILALIALVILRLPGRVSSPRSARLSLELPRRLTLANEFSAPFAIAPAGSPLVFEAVEGETQRLYVRELADSAVRALAGTENARQPFFSPDGAWIGFFASRKLLKVPVAGGPVLNVADTGGNPRGATWAPDGTIVFAAPSTSGLWRVSNTEGKPIALTQINKARGETSHRWPDVLPDGKRVLFTVGFEEAEYDEGRIEAVSLETGERRVLVPAAGFARYLHDGRLLFVRGGRLHAVGFDPERLEVRGTPEVVLDPVRYDVRNGGAHLTVSASGMVIYGPGLPVSAENYLAWVDREGQLKRITDTPRPFRNVRVSPDGGRVAAVIGTSTESDLWLVESNGTLTRLSFSLSPHRPTWTRGGDGITVGSAKDGVWRLLTVAADGKRDPTIHYQSPYRVYPNAWSPDGRYLIFQESRPQGGWDLQVLAIDSTGRAVGSPQALANTPFDETSAAISSDGRWVSYESDELDGVVQIYIRSFPDGGHKVRASPSGARWPVWDSEGNLHYWQTQPDTLQMVRTTPSGNQLHVESPQAIWRGSTARDVLRRIVNPVGGSRYDLEGAGRRFLVLEKSINGSEPELASPIAVLGWPKRPGF